MNPTKRVLFILLIAAGVLASSGCSNTRTENGVTIEKNRSYNPLDYIPGL